MQQDKVSGTALKDIKKRNASSSLSPAAASDKPHFCSDENNSMSM